MTTSILKKQRKGPSQYTKALSMDNKGPVRHWNRLSREVMDATYLELSKARLDEALGEKSVPAHSRRVGSSLFLGSRTFYDSMIL